MYCNYTSNKLSWKAGQSWIHMVWPTTSSLHQGMFKLTYVAVGLCTSLQDSCWKHLGTKHLLNILTADLMLLKWHNSRNRMGVAGECRCKVCGVAHLTTTVWLLTIHEYLEHGILISLMQSTRNEYCGGGGQHPSLRVVVKCWVKEQPNDPFKNSL